MNNPFAGTNLDSIKEMNISQVLKKIFEEKGISRIDIANSTEMSCAFVTKVISTLVSNGIVLEEKNTTAERGRPKVSLCFNGKHYAMAGLRINAKYISCALCDAEGELIFNCSCSSEGLMCGEDVYNKCCELLRTVLDHKGDKIVLGIGIAAPGPLPLENDRITALRCEPFCDLHEIPILARMQEDFGMPVVMQHDAHCGALNEYIFSADQKKYRNIVFIATDANIGAGILIDGKPYNGSGGLAGEIYYMVIGNDGDFGILGNSMTQQELIKVCGCSSMDELIQKVEAEDSKVCDAFDRFIRYLSVVIANFITTISPEAIVISDKIAILHERIEKICTETTEKLLPPEYRNSTELIIRPYSKHSVLRGACGAVLHRALEKPCEFFL